MTGSENFGRLLLAEWTKLRSVRRWVLALFAAAALSIMLSLLGAAGSRTDMNQHPDFVAGPDGKPVADAFSFVHQPITGDATITVRVASAPRLTDAARSLHGYTPMDRDPASAGVIVKESLTPGSRYAAAFVTPDDGVRLQANFRDPVTSSSHTTPQWLRLTRSGDTITGYESADGSSWQEIGKVTVPGLPQTAEIGFFVASPPQMWIQHGPGTVGGTMTPVRSTATFDNVSASVSGQWQMDSVVMPIDAADPAQKAGGPKPPGGEMSEQSGVFTVTGVGEIGPHSPPDDVVEISLFGILAGLLTMIAVGTLFITSEYRRGMIRTSFTANPRRGRVLAAKAVVLGAIAYTVGLVASVVSLLVAPRILRTHGFDSPGFPPVSLTDGPVIRAVLLTAAFVTAISLFSLGLGAAVRHSAAAITTAIVVVILPAIVGMAMPGPVGDWLARLTPAGGFATTRSQPPTQLLAEPWSSLSAWTGIGVTCAYAAGALLLAWWLLRRRDA
jgi:hypothetical protein